MLTDVRVQVASMEALPNMRRRADSQETDLASIANFSLGRGLSWPLHLGRRIVSLLHPLGVALETGPCDPLQMQMHRRPCFPAPPHPQSGLVGYVECIPGNSGKNGLGWRCDAVCYQLYKRRAVVAETFDSCSAVASTS